jgi:hypothetical protein
MFTIRSSIITTFNTSTLSYSTFTGSTLSFTSLLTTSTINPTNITSLRITYSTLTGSSIVATTVNTTATNIQQLSLTTFQQSTIILSTLTSGPTFTITNGANTGTISTLSYYQLDNTETTRVAALQQHDMSVAITALQSFDYTQFGLNWSIVNQLPLGVGYSSVGMSSTGQYQTLNADSTIYYSSNYGQTWSATTLASSVNSIAISTSGQYQIAALLGTTKGLYYSSNYGQTWTVASGTSALNCYQVCISASGQYASACIWNTSTVTYYSSNYGQTWTASNQAGVFFGIACSASGQYQVVGDGGQAGGAGAIYYSTTYGRTWIASNITNTSGYIQWGAMSATGQYASFATTLKGIWISSDYGRTWAQAGGGITAYNFRGISISASGQYQMAAGFTYGIYYSTNYGQTWSAGFPSGGNFFNIALSQNGQYAIACIASGGTPASTIYQSTLPFFTAGSSTNLLTQSIQPTSITFNDGSTGVSAGQPLDYGTFAINWTQSGSASQNWFAPSMSASGQYQVNAIYNGAIYYSSNYGQTWTAVPSSPTLLWGRSSLSASGQYAIICPGNNNIGTPGATYISSTYGQTWSATPISVNGCVAISATGQYMAICNQSAGTSGSSASGIFMSSNYGQSWTQTNTNTMYVICMSSTGQYLYASPYANTYAYYSTNYGQTWGIISGITPSSIGIQHITCSASGQYVTITGNATGLYYSNNYGQTFTKSASFTTAQCMCVAISASGQYQVTPQWNSSTIYYSTTYGVTWSSITGSAGQSLVAMSANGQYITISVGLGAFGGGGYIYTSITRTPPLSTSGTLIVSGQSNVTTTSGYTTLPGGIIMQFGNGFTAAPVVNSGSNISITFPKAFSSICYSVMASLSDLGTNVSYIENTVMATNYTTTSFTLYMKSVYSSFTFTPCGATGRFGPTSLNYTASSFPWGTLSSYVVAGTGSNGIPAGIQRLIIPYTGTYVITAAGAGAGNAAFAGGRGVIITTTVSLTANDTIFILVGQRGTNTGTTAGYQSSGGGGTFICKYNGGAVTSAGSYTILLIAGGGGGAGSGFGGGGSGAAGVGQGGDAVTTTAGGVNTTTGGVSVTRYYPAAATGGAGGNQYQDGSGARAGAGGGGFSGNGAYGFVAGSSQNTPGYAFINGGTGGTDEWSPATVGGFGGGGGTQEGNANWGVGGGGGYSGGAGPTVSSGWVWQDYGAGGGGSYDINGASNNATLTTSLGSGGYNPSATDGYAIVRLANRSTTPLTYYYVAYGK